MEVMTMEEAMKEHVSTLPERLMPLRNRLYREACIHPAWDGWTALEILKSVENHIYSLTSDYPWWWRQLEKDRPKQAATPAQLRNLELAQAAKRLKREEEAESYKRAEARVAA